MLVDCRSEGTVTPTATATTKRDVSTIATVKARLRCPCGRQRGRRVGSGRRGRVVTLACSHRALGRGTPACPQFGICGGSTSPGGSARPDRFGRGLGAASGYPCRRGTPGLRHRSVRQGFFAGVAPPLLIEVGPWLPDGVGRSAHCSEGFGLGGHPARLRWVRGVLVAQRGGGVGGSDAPVWESAPPLESPQASPRERPQDAGGAEVLLERAQGGLQLGGVGVELRQVGAELRRRQPVDGVEELQILAELCLGAGRRRPSRGRHLGSGQDGLVELERRDVRVDDRRDTGGRREGGHRREPDACRSGGRVDGVGRRLDPGRVLGRSAGWERCGPVGPPSPAGPWLSSSMVQGAHGQDRGNDRRGRGRPARRWR